MVTTDLQHTHKEAMVDFAFRHRYETLRSLLYKNGSALQLMSDLEADLNHLEYSDPALWRPVRRLLDESLLMAQELNLLSGDKYRSLYGLIEQLRAKIRTVFEEQPETGKQALALKLDAEECLDSKTAGGKVSGLAALRRHFPDRIPNGFVITIAAYRLFIEENRLADKIRLFLNDLEAVTDRHQFQSRTSAIREMIQSSSVPAKILDAIRQQATALGQAGPGRWAVRSSALSEDEHFSFAGQFDSQLNVVEENLEQAYLSVLAGRFSDRAILYRLHCGIREVDTPMAVLFLPMIDPMAAGVIYTNDPQNPTSGNMVVSAVPGLADRMVRGEQQGDILRLSREPNPKLVERDLSPAASKVESTRIPSYLPEPVLKKLGGIALSAAQALGFEMDIEWVLDKAGDIWLLQGRRLRMSTPEEIRKQKQLLDPPLLECGYTLFPGRAEGPVAYLQSPDVAQLLKKGAVAVIDQGTPEFAPILPHVAALLIRHGSPVGHLSALVREFSVPCLYQLEDGVKLLPSGSVISVDATKRRIYRGSRWPGTRKRVLARIAATEQKLPSGPLHDMVLALNLIDPFNSSFKAKKCRSLHDVIRFIHEMSVRSMFGFGDKQNRFWNKSSRSIESPLSIKLKLVDLDGSTPVGKGPVAPEMVSSLPFQALWRGISDSRISWTSHSIPAIDGMPGDFVEQVLGGSKGPRRPGDTNYAIVAADYLNLNARFAYHYAMVDAIVGPGKENNHVHFRYRGGGAGDSGRIRRAMFLEDVLRNFHFGVDRRGDLITAWLRNYTRSDSEKALEMVGRLMACSRQLDMFLSDDGMIKRLVQRFLNEEYAAFQ